jgi:serine/threonine protein kinase/Tol biopolymer transport system component
MIGSRLAHYDVTAHLGSGGFGDVYQANDTKLGRSVAIKLLPEAFSHDAERVARFKREAKILASLNHPNIAAIYGFEESSGHNFLVMEFVPGETLAGRIRLGPMRLEEALGIATQITDALEHAHEKTVIHRDLKLANIKITPEGVVKVLDFGLAKALAPEPADVDLLNSPTLSAMATQKGVILGTAAYMSPEQAKGREADRRADIFAFGAVLYEMLTGRQAFDGEDVQEILARVIEREPDWTLLPPDVPPRVRDLLRACLQKDRKKRRQTATDVRIDIEQALAEPKPSVAAMPVAEPPRGERLGRIMFAAAVLVAVVLAIPTVLYLRQTSPPEMRLQIVTPSTPAPLEFALSPDGRHIVFVASAEGPKRLWLRALDKTDAQPLAGTDGAEYPFWSPDGRSIGFFTSNKLFRIDISGGPPQFLTNAVGRGGSWNADGTILFGGTTGNPMSRIAASGGDPVAITRLDPPRQAGHRFPQFLPDGRHFLFYAQGSMEAQGIYLGPLDGGEPKRLTAADTAGAFLPPDWIVFVRQGALVARRLDIARGELMGDPVTLADPVGYDVALSFGGFSVSADGRVAYRAGDAGRRQLTWFDRTGKAVGVAGEPGANLLNTPELSPDGRRVAVSRVIQNNGDIWLMDLVRSGFTRFTFDPALNYNPLWSPDGTRVAFSSNRKASFNLHLMPSSGAGIEELLLETPTNKQPLDWSKDGRFLLYVDLEPKTARDLWTLEMTGSERKSRVLINTPFEERNGQFSPDGRWVAYETNESGQFEIVVQPFPEPTGKWQVSTNSGTQPRWRADGKEIYFIAPDGKLMAAPVTVSGSTFEAGTPVALFLTRIASVGATLKHQYVVSGDGRFLINTVLDDDASPITLLLNWKPPAQ